MADSFLAQQLPAFTAPDHPSHVCHEPFTFKLGGQPWAVAAGGPWFVAVKGSSSFPLMHDPAGIVEAYLNMAPVGALEVPTAHLKEWAGDFPLGGKFEEPNKKCLVQGVLVDRRKLAFLISRYPFPKITFWDSTSAVGVRSLTLESRGKWRAVLAGLDDNTPQDIPSYQYRIDGADAFDLMASLPEE